jgi:hypothetical protein
VSDETIEILVTAPAAGDRMFPGARVANVVTVATSQLRSALSAEIHTMARVFSEVDLTDTRYALDEVTFTVNVSAEGKVQVIGGFSATAAAGITITLRRK